MYQYNIDPYFYFLSCNNNYNNIVSSARMHYTQTMYTYTWATQLALVQISTTIAAVWCITLPNKLNNTRDQFIELWRHCDRANIILNKLIGKQENYTNK